MKRSYDEQNSSEFSLDASSYDGIINERPMRKKRRKGFATDSLAKGNRDYLNRDVKFLLLACVREFPDIWDVFSPAYTTVNRWDLWEDIAIYISAKTNRVVTREDAQEQWRNLRDTYVRKRRDGNTTSRGKHWTFYGGMSFMHNRHDILERYGYNQGELKNKTQLVEELLKKEENRRKALPADELEKELQEMGANDNPSFGVWPPQSREEIHEIAKEIRETGHSRRLDRWIEEQVEEQTPESYDSGDDGTYTDTTPIRIPAVLSGLFKVSNNSSNNSVIGCPMYAEIKHEEDFVNQLTLHSDSRMSASSQVSVSEERTMTPPPPVVRPSSSKNQRDVGPQRNPAPAPVPAVPAATEPSPLPVPDSKRESSVLPVSATGTFAFLEAKYNKWKTEDSRFADKFENTLMKVLLEHMQEFSQRDG